MNTFFLILIFYLLFPFSALRAQEYYFPLEVGNSWCYDEIVDIYLQGQQTITIANTISILEKQYYLCDRFFIAGEFVDSIMFCTDNQKVFLRYGDREELWFDFSANINDTWTIEIFDTEFDTLLKVEVSLFSNNSHFDFNGRNFDNCYIFHFRHPYTEHSWAYTLAPGFGIIDMWHGGSVQRYYKFRSGKIAGTSYPDLTSVEDNKNESYKTTARSSKTLSSYPNPFNSSTVIYYDLLQPTFVTLEIYNILGQKVRTLVAGQQAGGSYRISWDGLNDQRQLVPSGVYSYRIQNGTFKNQSKAVLVR